MASRGERRKRLELLKQARGPQGISSCTSSTTPRLLREAYSARKQFDQTIASYCATPLKEDTGQGFAT